MITNLNELKNFLIFLYPELIIKESKVLDYNALEISTKGKKATMRFHFSQYTESYFDKSKIGLPCFHVGYQEHGGSYYGYFTHYDLNDSLESIIQNHIKESLNVVPAKYQQLSIFDEFQLDY